MMMSTHKTMIHLNPSWEAILLRQFLEPLVHFNSTFSMMVLLVGSRISEVMIDAVGARVMHISFGRRYKNNLRRTQSCGFIIDHQHHSVKQND